LLYVIGRVLTCAGEPVSAATIDAWQANADGKYRHPSDVNPAELDPNFIGFARLRTDADGRYRLRTIKPGRYPTADGEIRPPHIHFSIEGRIDRLVTQLYFAGEPENHADRWLNAAPRAEELIARLDPAPPHLEPGARVAMFDIVMPSG
jgi:protocatechuate 3,4-dioxygenase beta subunit